MLTDLTDAPTPPTSLMREQHQRMVDDFCKHWSRKSGRPLAYSGLSTWALGDSGFVGKYLEGASGTVLKLERLERFLAQCPTTSVAERDAFIASWRVSELSKPDQA